MRGQQYTNVAIVNANVYLSGRSIAMARKKNKNQISIFNNSESIVKQKVHIARKKPAKSQLSNTCLGCTHQWKCTWKATPIHTLHCPAYQHIHSYKKSITNWSEIIIDINNLNNLSVSDKRKLHYTGD